MQRDDGQHFIGHLSFTNGAVCVSNANEVTSIPAAHVAELNFSAEELPTPTSEHGEGIGLLGLYFANTNATGNIRLRVDPIIDFDWGADEPMEGIGKDYFGVIWMGQVEAPGTGEFTFHLSADDGGRLQVGEQIYFNGSKHGNASEADARVQMQKGIRYPIMVFYFDYLGAARTRLTWSGPDLPKSPVPRDRMYPGSYIKEHAASIVGTNGWLATYYRSNDFLGTSLSRIEDSVDTKRSNHNASSRWCGFFRAAASEPLTFYAVTDDQMKLRVNGKVVLQRADRGALTETKVVLPVTTGEQYALEVETPTAGTFRLLWSSPSQPKSLVSSERILPYRPMGPHLSPTGPDLRQSIGVFFRNGSFMAGKVESADQETVECTQILSGKRVATRDLARIVCQPVPQAFAAKLQPERPGVLLVNGDFLEGGFRSLDANRVQIDSVLFGLRSFNIPSQVLAVVLQPLQAAPGNFELHLKDQSIFSIQQLEFHNGKVALNDSVLGQLFLSEDQLVRLVKR